MSRGKVVEQKNTKELIEMESDFEDHEHGDTHKNDETITELEWAKRHVPHDPFMAERKTEIIGCGISVRKRRRTSGRPVRETEPAPGISGQDRTMTGSPETMPGAGPVRTAEVDDNRFEAIEQRVSDLETGLENVVTCTVRTRSVPRERRARKDPELRRLFRRENHRCVRPGRGFL
jgi:hypothetical protein